MFISISYVSFMLNLSFKEKSIFFTVLDKLANSVASARTIIYCAGNVPCFVVKIYSTRCYFTEIFARIGMQ